VKRRGDGSIKFIRLRSVGDDRGHMGENHGRSTVTTERVRDDWGQLVGSDWNLKHKQSCAEWKPQSGPNPKWGSPNSTRAASSRPGPCSPAALVVTKTAIPVYPPNRYAGES
jgi:hypothetical protein